MRVSFIDSHAAHKVPKAPTPRGLRWDPRLFVTRDCFEATLSSSRRQVSDTFRHRIVKRRRQRNLSDVSEHLTHQKGRLDQS